MAISKKPKGKKSKLSTGEILAAIQRRKLEPAEISQFSKRPSIRIQVALCNAHEITTQRKMDLIDSALKNYWIDWSPEHREIFFQTISANAEFTQRQRKRIENLLAVQEKKLDQINKKIQRDQMRKASMTQNIKFEIAQKAIRAISTGSPWGINPENLVRYIWRFPTHMAQVDSSAILEALRANKYDVFLHRGALTMRPPLPVRFNPTNGKLTSIAKEVQEWKEIVRQPLFHFYAENLGASAASIRYKTISNLINHRDRFLLAESFCDLEKTIGQMRLRFDLVNLVKTKLGIEGRWVISLIGLKAKYAMPLLQLGWMKLTEFQQFGLDITDELVLSKANKVFVIETKTDVGAKDNLAFLLEEFFVGAIGCEILNYTLTRKPLPRSEFHKRSLTYETFTQRRSWIRRNPRGATLNHCIVCGQPLSVDLSVQREIGPHCWEKLTNEKEVRMIDLQRGYDPYVYESGISIKKWFSLLLSDLELLLSSNR